MSNSPSIIIEKLTVVGVDKNYEVNFKKGINVIWGDLDCGKSSILNLISYSLGASTLDTYRQLESKGRLCQLRVCINGERYVFERDIFNPKQYIRCYKNEISENVTPRILASSIEQELLAPDGYISFYILNLLGLPVTEIKVSPSKLDSTMNRVGFKDILKFIHLKQKDIASDSLLDMNNASRYIKNKEVLKYILNIHNEDISRINSDISESAKKQNDKEKEKNSILKFLESSGFDFNLDVEDEFKRNDFLLCEIESEIDKLKNNHREVVGFSDEIKKEVDDLLVSLNSIRKDKPKLNEDLEKYVKLKNTYNEEEKSLSMSIDVESRFNFSYEKDISCPLCLTKQRIDSKGSFIPLSVLKNEKKSLNRKLKSLSLLIDKIRCELSCLEVKELEMKSLLNEIQMKFNEKYADEVSMLVEAISLLEKEKLEILSNKKLTLRDKKIIDRLNMIDEEVDGLKKVISRLTGDLKKAENNSQDPAKVIENLSLIFIEIMTNSGLSDMTELSVNNKLDFIIRGKDFVSLTSGGVRTIASIGIYLSKLIYALKYDSNMPTLFMLDTPGNNIGRKRDESKGFDDSSDPVIYENIYKQLEQVFYCAEEMGADFQIIIVDNDLANTVEGNTKFHIAKRFSKADPNCDSGLINDL